MPDKISTTFEYAGSTHKLDIDPGIWNTSSAGAHNYHYSIFIDRYFYGRIVKKDGLWQPLDEMNYDNPKAHNLFRLQGDDYSVIGEIIERENGL